MAFLMLLVHDHDPEIATAAEATISAIPRAALEAFLARSDVSTEMREFFARRGIQPAPVPAQAADAPLVEPSSAADPLAAILAAEEEPSEGQVRESTVQKVASLNVAQRMTLAMKGSREERAVLIRDPNKIVAVAVLSSPKLTD